LADLNHISNALVKEIKKIWCLSFDSLYFLFLLKKLLLIDFLCLPLLKKKLLIFFFFVIFKEFPYWIFVWVFGR
jgi:hypothetical protein